MTCDLVSAVVSPVLGVAPAADAGSRALWVTLLAGIGIGTIVSSLVTLAGQRWQRRHELRLENMRDRQRLRDARLERLREDLREMMFVVFDVQDAANLVDLDSGRDSGQQAEFASAQAKFDSGMERFNTARARLVLDSEGQSVAQIVADLANGAAALGEMIRVHAHMSKQSPVHGAAEIAKAYREQRNTVNSAAAEVIAEARKLLQEIEQQPL